MPTPTIYTSADASAPIMTGEPNALNLVLHACLVTGYGAKPAAGWTRPFASGNFACFRPGAGLRNFLAINDANAQMSRVLGYESMSSEVAGTGPFPTEMQFSGGLYLRKSITATNQARPWILLATEESFHMIVFGGSTTYGTFGGGDSHLSFGQLVQPLLPGDVFHSFIIAASDTSTTSNSPTNFRQPLIAFNVPAGLTGHFFARQYTQTGGATIFGKRALNLYNQATSCLGGPLYPDPVTGSLNLARVGAHEGALLDRGWVPGVYSIGHSSQAAFANFDTVGGDGTLPGQAFIIVLTGSGGIAFETTGVSW